METYKGFSEPPKQENQQRKLGDYAELLARWIVDLVSLPVSFVAHLVAQFITPGASGTKIVGAIGFFIGTLLSTDGIWQVMFQGVPIFPWFEDTWIGWIGWLQLPFNPLFWLSFGISALVQIMEAKTLRGKDPNQAKSEFESSKQFTLGSKPSGSIDLTVALWGDYKRAGMKERHTSGAIALFFWVFDVTTTFVGRNPWRYTNPSQIMACLLYNFVSMMAGEIGYSIWKLTKK
ncbi:MULTISPECIES: hypothetical protein [unclassified Tolypothrix]|nr:MULTISPECIES: hypothetical protein [unclassified Tolypothrix]BAY95878.1 hypothetical protein NIES3275_79550 [Microchaete diplosiphon NIES-3275]EKE96818.1 hypothetical protein FDUTEX481_06361 [Tolypothrix sp. PCC 7601]MBE9083920.1 hypothetical protein [Tolypothrix sp. LEGE 11397]UYD30985.1 hypothetical protein HGR01_39600 [Tolypothrix sp. PCC 7712]UYD38836.1 hypothetical protein HG267_40835 [Tolypothrix sp. PCC 7601]